MVQEIPREAYELGEIRAEFGPYHLRAAFFSIAGAILILSGLALLFASLGIVLPAIPDGAGCMAFTFGSGMLGSGAILLIRTWPKGGLYVTVFDRGLVYRKGHGTKIYPWDRIKEFYQYAIDIYVQGIIPTKWRKYTVYRDDGDKFVFARNLKNADELAVIIQRETLPFLLPQALTAFRQDGFVRFGKLSVDQEGLTFDSASRKDLPRAMRGNVDLSWQEVEYITLQHPSLIIKKRGTWIRRTSRFRR